MRVGTTEDAGTKTTSTQESIESSHLRHWLFVLLIALMRKTDFEFPSGKKKGCSAPQTCVFMSVAIVAQASQGASISRCVTTIHPKKTMSLISSENWNPNAGLHTSVSSPVLHRRAWLRIPSNATALSPTKRRKQNHSEEVAAMAAAEPLKRTPSKGENLQALSRSDLQTGKILCEVFSRLGVRDLVNAAAPVCRVWRDEVYSEELWASLRTHMRLIDQLLVSEKIVERRSKGKLFKCRRLGASDPVLVRIVNLELTNAGKDDGVPTSFLREAALLSKVRHPNIIRNFGSEIIGHEAAMCTEFVFETFTQWHKRLEVKTTCARLLDLRGKYRQLLVGLSFVHHQGIMHRNLKPDNIFLDQKGIVKLGDFTTTRMLDIPLQSYTPEDPKERERSGREMRRLWYRAPELILRDEIYGPRVDIWSVGCLLSEAATGRALFQSDSEIDHLFRTFRLIGTPSLNAWPEALAMKNFSPKFPIYQAFNFAQVARAVCCGDAADLEMLRMQANPDRTEVLKNLLGVASVLGADGMLVFSRMLTCPPPRRAGADEVLGSPFFSDRFGEDTHGPHALTSRWMREDLSGAELEQELGQAPCTPRQPEDARACVDDHPGAVLPSTCEDFFDVPVPSLDKFITSRMVWDILEVMQRSEATKPIGEFGLDANQRSVMVDFMVGLASTLNLTAYTLHLASCMADKCFSYHEGGVSHQKMRVIGATCLKVADLFAEQSKEYYKQENTAEYARAVMQQASPAQILLCEKDVLPRLGFDLRLPTVHWFLQCYLAYARFSAAGAVAKTAFFIGDLALLDYDLLAYAPSLRAQCAFLLAAFLIQWALADKKHFKFDATAETPTSEPSGASLPRKSAALPLPYLDHWDEHVRDAVCRRNTAVQASMCLQAVVRTLVVMRREWKSAKLIAVETKHAENIRALTYPEIFPVSKLVRYILPTCQRGLIPE